MTEGNMERHAYLIIAHDRFGQLRKLVELLDDPRNDIFIHVDAKADFSPEKSGIACRHSGLTFLKNRVRVHWGGPSIMRVEINLLKEATSRGRYGYYHLLSGMDLPIKSQDQVHEFFRENAGYEFIDFWRMDEDTLSRVRWYTPFPESERNFIGHAVNKTCRNIQKACGSGINGDVDFKCGSQWFSITDEMARYVISQEEWLWKTFGHTIICDEIFLATLAAASPLRDRLYRNPDNPPEVKASRIRLIDWTRGESIRHPWTFRAGDFEMLMNAPQFWARKFDEKVDSEIIDRVCGAVRNAKDGGTEA